MCSSDNRKRTLNAGYRNHKASPHFGHHAVPYSDGRIYANTKRRAAYNERERNSKNMVSCKVRQTGTREGNSSMHMQVTRMGGRSWVVMRRRRCFDGLHTEGE